MGEPTASGHGDDPTLDAALQRLETCRGRPLTISELGGGLTNRNYKVVTPDGAYVVRVSPTDVDALAIDRDNEYRNSIAAASSGVGAKVIEHLPGILVVEFIDGRTLSDADFGEAGVIPRIAAACRTLHSGPRFVNDFNMFDVLRGYLATIERHGFRVPDGYTSFFEQVAELKGVLARSAEATVPCNNDLLAANFIDTGDTIRLIDYEYSGNNDPCFELGNIWSECHLSDEQIEELVTSYYGRSRPSRLACARLQGLMSRYGWTLWASIRHSTATSDFDFWSWGMDKYARAVETFRSPQFAELLCAAQNTD